MQCQNSTICYAAFYSNTTMKCVLYKQDWSNIVKKLDYEADGYVWLVKHCSTTVLTESEPECSWNTYANETLTTEIMGLAEQNYSESQCKALCNKNRKCMAINYNPKTQACTMNSNTYQDASSQGKVAKDDSGVVYEKKDNCLMAAGDGATATYSDMYEEPDSEYLIDGFGQTMQVTLASTATPSRRLVEGMRAKFMDYFLYAMVTAEGVKESSIGECPKECGTTWKQKCCAGVTLYNPDNELRDFSYHCINQAVASTELSVALAEFEVTIECDNTYSGAIKLATQGLLSAGVLVLSLM